MLAAGMAVTALAEPTPIQDAFSLILRPRFESAQQTGKRSSDAFTLGTNVGFTLQASETVALMIEIEDTRALDSDRYNQAGLNPAASDRVVIADPEGYEGNQLWISFNPEEFASKLGRQPIVYDNARFIGNVDWRQNMQTFDAVRIGFKTDVMTFDYAYLDRVNRILGRDHPQGEWESESHLFNFNWKFNAAHSLTGYSYRLTFENAAVNSTVTNGLAFIGSVPIGDGLQFPYRAEFATQTSHDNNPLQFDTTYRHLVIGLKAKTWALNLGQELLGSNRGVGFKTPLATAHAFNGWADLFLATPADGLDDIYVQLSGNLPAALKGTVVYHMFDTATRTRSLGQELDLSIARGFGSHVKGLIKYADFQSDSALPDVTRFWIQMVYTY